MAAYCGTGEARRRGIMIRSYGQPIALHQLPIGDVDSLCCWPPTTLLQLKLRKVKAKAATTHLGPLRERQLLRIRVIVELILFLRHGSIPHVCVAVTFCGSGGM